MKEYDKFNSILNQPKQTEDKAKLHFHDACALLRNQAKTLNHIF